MKFLITGSNGLLGQKIVRQLLKENIHFIGTSKGENRNPDLPDSHFKSMDITDKENTFSVVSEFKPDVIIHTAAMTNVDACETNPETCQMINVTGTKNCFEAAKTIGAQLVSLSTDFVFDGENGPYKEEDKRNPLSIYAKSKVDAEDLLIEADYRNWSIIRTIIVFGKGNNLSRSNIVLWAHEALQSGKELTIVNDQFRAPTWADDLAWACIESGKRNAKGIYHISGPKTYSIFDLVLEIGKFHNMPIDNIEPISSTSLNQAAKRPPRTGFILDKAMNELGYKPKTFAQALEALGLQAND